MLRLFILVLGAILLATSQKGRETMGRDAFDTLVEKLGELDGPVQITEGNLADILDVWTEGLGQHTKIPKPAVGGEINPLDLIVLVENARNNRS